mmetsp:Transcript_15216/g.22840  ORF Transcript_15216/g.22840 Transcript_15216/m.22840 type:complete len:268 (-) Transcript_15216:2273-3076(-)
MRHVHVLGANGIPGATYKPLLRELKQAGYSVGVTEYYKSIQKVDTNLYKNCIDYVRNEARTLRAKLPEETKITAFGHSLGGVLALLAAREEMIFDEIVAFDPPLFSPFSRGALFLFQVTGLIERWPTVRRWRRRPSCFDSPKSAERWVRAQRFYQNFHPECLDAFIDQAIDNQACFKFTPEFEAQFFIQTPSLFGFGGDDRMYSQKPTCHVDLYYSTLHEFVYKHDISWLRSHFLRNDWPVDVQPLDVGHFYPLEHPIIFARDFLLK